jgi:anti-anti-sigma regulatory factor
VSVQATDPTAGTVNCVHLADGKLVQLSGRLGRAELPALRLALLTPLFEDCRDVVVDAGEVESVDDEAVAVLVAAEEWARYAGARLLLSRAAPALEQALIGLDLADRIPRLSQLNADSRQPRLVPVPRAAAD